MTRLMQTPQDNSWLDLGLIIDRAVTAQTIEYRDPFPLDGDNNPATRAQDHAWRFLRDRDGKGPRIAMIGAKGSGKMLADSEPVLTPNGWVDNGSLRRGDTVIGRDGAPTRVTGVFPQGTQQIVRVDMTDGTYVRASWDHLWAVQTGSQRARGRGFKVLTTREICDDLTTAQGYVKWYLPEMGPVEYAPVELPLAPYALGALLGDGGLTQSTPVFSSADPEIVERVARESGVEARYRSQYDYGLTLGYGTPNPLTAALRTIGCMGVGAREKRIPELYLMASVEARIELMRGLMDTDGSVTSSGTGEFYTSSRGLADDFCTLARSLGLVTKVATKRPPPNTEYDESFRVRINAPFNPFWVKRKAERFNTAATQGRVKGIRACVENGIESATCISVEAEDSLYVTRDFNVTHNTHFGSAFAFHMGQLYPESMGCVISNTYSQAKDNAAPLIVKMARQLGYAARFFQTKTIKDRPYTSLFVVDLDGNGYEEGQNFYILLRSFEAVNKLEGIELDWLWCEEIQDARLEDFNTAFTRIRGQNADNSVFVAGMPEDEGHWMYKQLPRIGATPEEEVRRELDIEAFDVREFETAERVPVESEVDLFDAPVRGLLLEPSIFENKHHLPENYIADMKASLDAERAEQWIYGRRTSMSGNRVAHQYEASLHRNGRMSRVLCHYDPALAIILSVDFNVAPMSCTAWQEKGWNDAWNSGDIVFDAEDRLIYQKVDIRENGTEKIVGQKTVPVNSFGELAAPDRTVLAQIDEWEIWEGGTRGLVTAIVGKYGPEGLDHTSGIRILGDSTGDRRDTRSETTDWEIIQDGFMAFDNAVIQPGVEMSSDYKKGTVTYRNPERRDTFNVLNAALKDGLGRVWLCFLPRSPLSSGGAAAATQGMRYKADGTFDVPRPKESDRDAIRDHLFDTVRYVIYDFRGGVVAPEAWNRDAMEISTGAVLSDDVFGSETFGDSWSGVFG